MPIKKNSKNEKKNLKFNFNFQKLKNLLKREKKQETFNFYKSIKFVKNQIAKSNFDLAFNALNEIYKKEKNLVKSFEDKDSKNNKNYQIFKKREILIKKIFHEIDYKKAKKECFVLLKEINYKYKNKDFSKISEDLSELNDKYISKYKEFAYLKAFHKKYTKKYEKIKKLAYTKNVSNFKDLVKKIGDLIMLGDYDLAEKGINETLKKETESFNIIKNDNFITKRKLNKSQRSYEKKAGELGVLSKKIFVLRSKKLRQEQEKRRKELLKEIKSEINGLLKTSEFELAKNFIEKNIHEQKDDIEFVDFLNRKNQLVTKKLKSKLQSKLKNQSSIEEVNSLLKSIGEQEKKDLLNVDEKLKNDFYNDLIKKFKAFFEKYLSKKQSSFQKKVSNELKYLLESEKGFDENKIKQLNSKYHEGMSKILQGFNLGGYRFYGKILGADKVTGDTFMFEEKKDRYWFALGDATGHGLKAGLIVSNFTKSFIQLARDYDKFESFSMNLNNILKGTLKSGNFLTCHLFEIKKSEPGNVKIIGMGHEPLFVYRKNSNSIEEYRPFGLAAGIIKILKIESIKPLMLQLKEGDVVVSYTDGIIEAKNSLGEMYGLERFKEKFLESINKNTNLNSVYNFLMDDLKNFSGKVNYDDDVTIILFSRNTKTDIIDQKHLENIIENLNLTDSGLLNRKKLEGKTREDIINEINNIKLKKELNIVTQKLHELLKDGEIIKLKEECLKYIKQGYVSAKINNYLKKAIRQEQGYKIEIKEKKLQTKYNTLMSLYSKGNYEAVIKESYDVILKNGNI